jgi:hypothetical protein
MIDLQATALKGFVEGLGCSQNKCPLGILLGMHRFSEMPYSLGRYSTLQFLFGLSCVFVFVTFLHLNYCK